MWDLNISRNVIFLNVTCENVENISLFCGPRVFLRIKLMDRNRLENTICLGLPKFFISFKFSVSLVISIYTLGFLERPVDYGIVSPSFCQG